MVSKPQMKITHDNIEYELVTGRGSGKDTVFLQFNRLGGLKPTPIIFACRRLEDGEATVSMHYEALPFPVFTRLVETINNLLIDNFDEANFE